MQGKGDTRQIQNIMTSTGRWARKKSEHSHIV